MLYKIIGDSCMDLTEELKLDPHFQMIPLTLQIGDYKVTDDETFNQKEFLAKVKASPECPKTACPSPESFKEAFEGEAEYIFVVTLSNHLSGCYNSAALAKRLYEEENGTDGKKIAVIDSLSASAGELNIALFIRELCEKEVVQLEQGVCLGRADDLELDPATAQLQSLILLGRPRLFGLLGRDESLTIPWREIETIGTDAILVHTAVPKAPAAPHGFWQQLRAKLGL